jgi:hypothetical protein
MRSLALLLVSGLAGGCTLQFGDFSSPDVWVAESETIDLSAGGYDCVDVATHNGRIAVVAGSEGRETITLVAVKKGGGDDEEEAHAALREIVVERRSEGRTLVVESNWREEPPSGLSACVDFELTVPPRFAVRLHSHNGDVGVTGLAGAVDVVTHNGAVTLRDVRSRVRAESHNGRIECCGDGQPIELDTHNGAVRFSTTACCVSGSITSHNGDIVLDLPDDARGTIEGHGRFRRSDLPSPARCIMIDDRDFTIELRDPGAARLEVATHNGSVQLR